MYSVAVASMLWDPHPGALRALKELEELKELKLKEQHLESENK